MNLFLSLSITGTIRGTSEAELYRELGLESLRYRRWLRWVWYLYETVLRKLPPYLFEIFPPLQKSYRYLGCFQTLRCRIILFLKSVLPFTITEWNKSDSDIKNTYSHAMFYENLLTFARPKIIHMEFMIHLVLDY